MFYDKCLKMNECNSIEHDFHETPNMYPKLNAIPLSNQQQLRLNKTNEIKYYFVAEIKERELMRKRLTEIMASFEYFDMPLIVSSVTTGSISIASFATVTGAPVGIMVRGLVLHF